MSLKTKQCQALCCHVDLKSTGRAYCIKRGLCPEHMKADAIKREGHGDELWRFCQQCGKLEPLARFQGDKRSCKTGLKKRRVNTTGNNTDTKTDTMAADLAATTSAAASTPERIAQLQLQIQAVQHALDQLKQDAAPAAAAAAAGGVTTSPYRSTGSSHSDLMYTVADNSSSSDSERLAAAVVEGYLGVDDPMQQQQQQQTMLSLDCCIGFEAPYSPAAAAALAVAGPAIPAATSTRAAAAAAAARAFGALDIAAVAPAAAPAIALNMTDWMTLEPVDDNQFDHWLLQHCLQTGSIEVSMSQPQAVPYPSGRCTQQLAAVPQHVLPCVAQPEPAEGQPVLAGAAAGAPGLSEVEVGMMIELELWRIANGLA